MNSPACKRAGALREVIVAEQIQRMLLSNHAILEFEDLRLQLVAEHESQKARTVLDRMETILRKKSHARNYRCLPRLAIRALAFSSSATMYTRLTHYGRSWRACTKHWKSNCRNTART